MAFIDIEGSVEGGEPIYLYQFLLDITIIDGEEEISVPTAWRYTSSDKIVTRDGFDWEPAAIIDESTVKFTGEPIVDAFSIIAPSWIGPSQVFMAATPPSRAIQATVFATHAGTTEIRAIYVGEVTQVNFPMPGQARVTMETIGSTMNREGLRLGWQRSCPYVVYDPLTCKLSKTAFDADFTIISIDGFTVTIDLQATVADDFYNGGFIEWMHPFRGNETLQVESSENISSGGANHRLVLFTDPGELSIGITGKIYPGCDFTPAKCQSYGNYDNYGGVPDLPGRSPFDGMPVF